MNTAASQHLAKAREYVGRGEEFYRKAAGEIRAAKDAGATWPEIADSLGRGLGWAKEVVAWAESPANDDLPDTPFGGERERKDRSAAKQVLSNAPLEQVEQMITTLPKERQQAIAAAAGNAYAKARQKFEEREASLTPAERKEREAAADAIQQPIQRAMTSFTSMGVALHLQQATEDLREIINGGGPSSEQLEAIETATAEYLGELEVARATSGSWEVTA